MKVVIDSSVYIDYLRSSKGIYPLLMKSVQSQTTTLYTPTIVVLEIWRGEHMANETVEKQAQRLIAPTTLVELSRQIAKVAGKLLRDGLIDNALDAVVAATALELNAQLATGNSKHFKKVKGLQLFGE